MRSYYLATCTKHKVELKDADDIVSILDMLTKEILDSSFLPKDDKENYSKEIEKVKYHFINDEIDNTEIANYKLKEEENTRTYSRMVSLLLAGLSTLFSYLTLLKMDGFSLPLDSNIEKIKYLALVILTIFVIVISMIMYLEVKSKVKNK